MTPACLAAHPPMARCKTTTMAVKKITAATVTTGSKANSEMPMIPKRKSSASNRMVEPIRLGDDYQTLHAVDVEDGIAKYFKIDRIEDIKITRSKKRLKIPEQVKPDAFGMMGEKETIIILRMNLRSHLLLKEEYPLAANFVTKEKNGYLLKIPVRSFEGIGRFVMGLIDSIQVVSPKEFKGYIANKIKSFKL